MSETNQTSFKNIMNFLFSFKLKNLTIDKYWKNFLRCYWLGFQLGFGIPDKSTQQPKFLAGICSQLSGMFDSQLTCSKLLKYGSNQNLWKKGQEFVLFFKKEKKIIDDHSEMGLILKMSKYTYLGSRMSRKLRFQMSRKVSFMEGICSYWMMSLMG
jgi:hypothetical protein